MMHSKILKTLVLSVLILFLLTGVASAQEWVVTAGGDVDKVNLSTVNLDKLTLREAIAKASSGDTIIFGENITNVSLVHGTLNVSKDLTIGGSTKVTVRRDSSSVTQEMTLFTVTGANVTFKQLTLENGSLSSGLGGAVLADKSNVTFESCTIQRNKADMGGAIYVANGSIVNINSSSLFRNNATTDGSAVYIKNGTVQFYNSVVEGHSDKYNVIKADQGKIIASQTRVINNEITSKGSPMNASSGTTVEFKNSTFSNNKATESAGIMAYGSLLVENCVFDGGVTSGSGGGVTLGNGSVGTIKYSVFSNANVSDDGGGVHVASNASATIDTCTFINNIANYGGAFFSRGTLNVTSSTAVNNTAKFYGGAAALWNDGTATMTKTVLAGNTAKSNNTARDTAGGGLNISNSQAVLSNNVIVGNTDPRNVDFGQTNSTVSSGGNNLVGTYNGSRYPIEATDVLGTVVEDVFVIENGLPALTRATGYTAGYDKVPVYTVALNSSASNPAASILGAGNQTPAPEENDTTPEPEPPVPDETGPGSRPNYLVYGLIAVILLAVLGVGAFLLWRFNEKRKYKFG